MTLLARITIEILWLRRRVIKYDPKIKDFVNKKTVSAYIWIRSDYLSPAYFKRSNSAKYNNILYEISKINMLDFIEWFELSYSEQKK